MDQLIGDRVIREGRVKYCDVIGAKVSIEQQLSILRGSERVCDWWFEGVGRHSCGHKVPRGRGRAQAQPRGYVQRSKMRVKGH